jgi:hypothetical protein
VHTLGGGGREGNLGILTTCIKSIHLQNVLDLILGFTFSVWALYFHFHKINAI